MAVRFNAQQPVFQNISREVEGKMIKYKKKRDSKISSQTDPTTMQQNPTYTICQVCLVPTLPEVTRTGLLHPQTLIIFIDIAANGKQAQAICIKQRTAFPEMICVCKYRYKYMYMFCHHLNFAGETDLCP